MQPIGAYEWQATERAARTPKSFWCESHGCDYGLVLRRDANAAGDTCARHLRSLETGLFERKSGSFLPTSADLSKCKSWRPLLLNQVLLQFFKWIA